MGNVLDLYNSFKGGMGGFKGSKLIYPLENQADYLGKITFTPVIEDPVDLGREAVGVIDTIKNAGAEAEDDRNLFQRSADFLGELATSEEARKELGAQIGSAAKKTKEELAKFYTGSDQTAGIEPRQPLNESLNLNVDRRIQLYLPRAIQIADTATYDNTFQLGFIGGAAEKGLTGSGAGIAAAARAGLSLAQDTTASVLNQDALKGMPREGAAVVAARIASAIPGGGDGICLLYTSPSPRDS